MIKFIAFEIDDMITQHRTNSNESAKKHLLELQKQGINICLISGKPVDHISEFAKQLGLKDPIIVGENGADIYFGNNRSIEKEIMFLYPEEDKEILDTYIKELKDKYIHFIRIHPNKVNFSFSLKELEHKWEIYKLTDEYFNESNFEFYLHSDSSFDIIYKGIHKGWAINQIKRILECDLQHFITIGNGISDVPMFQESYFSIGINRNDAKFKVNSIEEAFQMIDKIIRNQ